MATNSIRILIVDDHPVVRDGISSMLNYEKDICTAGQASHAKEAIRLFRTLQPDVTLIDIGLPEMDGIETISAVRKEFPDARFIVLTVYSDEEDIYRAFQAGAKAYLLKDAPQKQIVETIRLVHQGRRAIPPSIASKLAERITEEDLTPREMEVLRLMAQGKTNQEIARSLSISTRTVKAHINSIMSKLYAANRTHAVLVALHRGIVRLP